MPTPAFGVPVRRTFECVVPFYRSSAAFETDRRLSDSKTCRYEKGLPADASVWTAAVFWRFRYRQETVGLQNLLV